MQANMHSETVADVEYMKIMALTNQFIRFRQMPRLYYKLLSTRNKKIKKLLAQKIITMACNEIQLLCGKTYEIKI